MQRQIEKSKGIYHYQTGLPLISSFKSPSYLLRLLRHFRWKMKPTSASRTKKIPLKQCFRWGSYSISDFYFSQI
ncbi:hypothetical protein CMV_011879 [Castanea mollissima]|uniref:Uncharacterized protein n=1 Tax=Castanea mollissima TaxID=60419 RepID=A0A8J4RFW1_9ROSI|nr:hypothetical protein CMV_011879 [Castanea mollissima]